MLRKFNPYAPEVISNPYKYYRALRNERPVYFNDELGIYFLSRYADVKGIGRNQNLLIRGETRAGYFDQYEGSALYRIGPRYSLFAMDEPGHGRLRSMIISCFTSSSIDDLTPTIQRICTHLLDHAELDPRGGSFELIEMLANPLPFLVLCELLGISNADRTDFRRWIQSFTAMLVPSPAPDDVIDGMAAGEALEAYFTVLLEERRKMLRAGRPLPTGLISDLLAISEQHPESLTPLELICTCRSVVTAGFENITILIGNTMRALAENPDQARALRSDPSLYQNLTDEALRYYSTTQHNSREAARNIGLHGMVIPKGAQVVLLRGAANRDERHFADPDNFDLRRFNSRSQIGFGEGAYHCIGAALTRIQIQIVFRELFRRFKEISILRWRQSPSSSMWGPRMLEVEYVASPPANGCSRRAVASP
jgi:pimeloyl-[acyl-carrier protein] synthase